MTFLELDQREQTVGGCTRPGLVTVAVGLPGLELLLRPCTVYSPCLF